MLLEESLAFSRGEEHAWSIAHTLASLGSVACDAGEYAQTSRYYEESLELGWRMGSNLVILTCLKGLARVALAQYEAMFYAGPWIWGSEKIPSRQ
jgi:hypothetical protein